MGETGETIRFLSTGAASTLTEFFRVWVIVIVIFLACKAKEEESLHTSPREYPCGFGFSRCSHGERERVRGSGLGFGLRWGQAGFVV